MMLTNEQAILFLKTQEALSVSAIEKEARLPTSTLLKAVAGTRKLNSNHLTQLLPVLRKYGYGYSPDIE